MTEDGLVPISEVEPDTLVLAYNEKTGEIGYYSVTAVWEHVDSIMVTLTIDGEQIETTPEHPFYTIDGEWLTAAKLQIGDEIRSAEWQTGIVESIDFTVTPQSMYNFTVATAHTYFVGEGQWLVHNACPLGTSFGKLGTLVDDPVIKITQITDHTFDRHAVTAEMIHEWATLDKAVLSQNGGERFLNITADGAYVIDAVSGRVITAWSRAEYRPEFVEIAQQLGILP